MRLYTAAALLVSARAEVVRDGGVLIDGTRIVAAGPAGPLRASAGIDNCPHGAYVCGLEALAWAGLPTRDVLDAATARAARAIGVGDRTGSIEPGKDADLIASAATRCVTSPCCTGPSWL